MLPLKYPHEKTNRDDNNQKYNAHNYNTNSVRMRHRYQVDYSAYK
nr:MAG TPA: hypothetical protein [Caudoviricetes sp.]